MAESEPGVDSCPCSCHLLGMNGRHCERCRYADVIIGATHNTGRKDDAGKARFDLIPPDILLEVAKVFTHGARLYGAANYRLVADGRARYTGAFFRHMNAWQRGEDRDPESGLLHLAHAITCLMILGDLPDTAGGES